MRGRILDSAILIADKSNYSHIVDLAVEITRTVEDYSRDFLQKHDMRQEVVLLALALTTRLRASELSEQNPITEPDPVQIVASLSPLLFCGSPLKLDADHLVYNVTDAKETDGYDYLRDVFAFPSNEGDADAPLGGDNDTNSEQCEEFAELILGLVNAKSHERDDKSNEDTKRSFCICFAALVAALRRLLISAQQHYGKTLSFNVFTEYIDGTYPLKYSRMKELMKDVYRDLFSDGVTNEYIESIFSESDD